MNAISMIESAALQQMDEDVDFNDAWEAACQLPQFDPVSDDNICELLGEDDDVLAELARLMKVALEAAPECRARHQQAIGAYLISASCKRQEEAARDYVLQPPEFDQPY